MPLNMQMTALLEYPNLDNCVKPEYLLYYSRTHQKDRGHAGLSSLSPLFSVFNTSALSTAGYGILPSENTSQQVTPYDHYI